MLIGGNNLKYLKGLITRLVPSLFGKF